MGKVIVSTSGKSANVVKAIKVSKEMDIFTIGFTGETEGPITKSCDICLKVPSKDTPRIQEAHILIGHILCEIIERIMFE